jgi:ribosomal protein S18 acetylase RimI-like enzyme
MDSQPIARGAIHLEEITANSSAESLSAAQELLLEYGQFVISHKESAGFCYGSLEQEVARLPFSYIEKQGGCLIARVDDKPAGFVGWRAVPATVASDSWELKRLWVRSQARGLNLGRILTQAVVDRAVQARRKAVYLDTAPAVMAAAHRLYVTMGFEPCAPYNNTPVHGLVWMVKRLRIADSAAHNSSTFV